MRSRANSLHHTPGAKFSPDSVGIVLFRVRYSGPYSTLQDSLGIKYP